MVKVAYQSMIYALHPKLTYRKIKQKSRLILGIQIGLNYPTGAIFRLEFRFTGKEVCAFREKGGNQKSVG